MKNVFLNFINEKYEEAEGKPMNYEQECSMIGTHPLTSRQPASFHAMLSTLEKAIPMTSRGEIIYTAIKSAFDTFTAQFDSYETTLSSRYQFLFSIAYSAKSAKDAQDGQTGFCVPPSLKVRADLLLAAIKDGNPIDDIEEEFHDLISYFRKGE